MLTVYDLFYLALTPAVAPMLAYKALTKGKYRESAPAMLGRQLAAEDPRPWENGSLWMHGVSVGEVLAGKCMLPHLHAAFPQFPRLVTTVTETGQQQARSLVPDLAEAVRYYPLDFSWVVKRFTQVYRPRMMVLMETELWPNALRIVSDSGAKIFVLNGVLSEKSYAGYSKVAGLLREPLSRVSAFCMQTQKDAERIAALAGSDKNVFVTGNCKFDSPDDMLAEQRKAELRAMCGLSPKSRVVVVGSTHPGEEEFVFEAVREVSRHTSDVVFLLAPRHPERFGKVWEMITAQQLPARRLSDAPIEVPSGILLVDRMGILSQLYAIADVAVVAGSFVPNVGGHNLLEAAVHAVPVVYGPYMHKQPDMVRILGAEDGGVRVAGENLGKAILDLLDHPEVASQKGDLGRSAVLRNRGAATRNIDIMMRSF